LESVRLPPRANAGPDMKRLFSEALGYAAASGCALIADMGILWILVHFFSCDYLAAASVSFMAGATVAYVLAVKFAFRQHRLGNRSAEFVSFVAIGAVGLAVNAGVMAIAVAYFGLHYMLAKCVAAGFTFTCNFFTRRQILFVRQPLV
jgi:putative flippase GtrA